MAERAGFEPAVRYKRTLAFQASALSRSATSPYHFQHQPEPEGGIDSFAALPHPFGAHYVRPKLLCSFVEPAVRYKRTLALTRYILYLALRALSLRSSVLIGKYAD